MYTTTPLLQSSLLVYFTGHSVETLLSSADGASNSSLQGQHLSLDLSLHASMHASEGQSLHFPQLMVQLEGHHLPLDLSLHASMHASEGQSSLLTILITFMDSD